MTSEMTITMANAIMGGTLLLALGGIWVRFEHRTTKLETQVEEIRRLVINGNGKSTHKKRSK